MSTCVYRCSQVADNLQKITALVTQIAIGNLSVAQATEAWFLEPKIRGSVANALCLADSHVCLCM